MGEGEGDDRGGSRERERDRKIERLERAREKDM